MDVLVFFHVIEDQQPMLAILVKSSMKGRIAHIALIVREGFLKPINLHERRYTILDSDLAGSVDPDCSIVFLWYSSRIQMIVSVFGKDLSLADTPCTVDCRSFLTTLRLICVAVIVVKEVLKGNDVLSLSGEATAQLWYAIDFYQGRWNRRSGQ